MESTTNNNPNNEPEALEFEARVQATQRRLGAELQSSYDFIVCGEPALGGLNACLKFGCFWFVGEIVVCCRCHDDEGPLDALSAVTLTSM